MRALRTALRLGDHRLGALLLGAHLLGAGPLLAAAPSEVARQARAWRAQHEREVLREFAELLAIPNVAVGARDSTDLDRNARAIQSMLAKRGVAARLLTLAGAPPLVVGELRAPRVERTIAFYAHYDGQPVDAAAWRSPPFTPVMRDANGHDVDWQHAAAIDPEWRLYARAAGDDKASIVAMLAALDALHAAGGTPAVNLRFVFEGEEEAGSPHLAEYLARYPEILRPAVTVCWRKGVRRCLRPLPWQRTWPAP